MKELIGIAILIASLFGGTLAAKWILCETRKVAIAKAAQGLPRLSPFATELTRNTETKRSSVKMDKKICQ